MFALAGRWPWSPYDAAVPPSRDQKRTSRLLLAPSPVLFQTGRGALIDVPQRTPTQLLTPLACALDGLAKTSNGIGILHRNQRTADRPARARVGASMGDAGHPPLGA